MCNYVNLCRYVCMCFFVYICMILSVSVYVLRYNLNINKCLSSEEVLVRICSPVCASEPHPVKGVFSNLAMSARESK